jgi:hypothetical protein
MRIFQRAAETLGIQTSSEPGLHENVPHPSAAV